MSFDSDTRHAPLRRYRTVLVLSILLSAALVAWRLGSFTVEAEGEQAQPPLPVMTIEIEGHRLQVEIASTGQQRYMGLSFRTDLAVDEGMLFVYPEERPMTFTMRHTLLPLSLAYISADRVINQIIDMDVGPGQLFPSRKPAMFALEVNQGWFRERGIGVGARVEFP